MTPQSVSPQEAKRLIDQGAVLIDIRDPVEYLREHIPNARSLPLTDITAGKKLDGTVGQPIIFHCLSGGARLKMPTCL